MYLTKLCTCNYWYLTVFDCLCYWNILVTVKKTNPWGSVPSLNQNKASKNVCLCFRRLPSWTFTGTLKTVPSLLMVWPVSVSTHDSDLRNVSDHAPLFSVSHHPHLGNSRVLNGRNSVKLHRQLVILLVEFLIASNQFIKHISISHLSCHNQDSVM